MSTEMPERSWEDQMVDPDNTMDPEFKQRVLSVLHAWQGSGPDWYRVAASSKWPAIHTVQALDDCGRALAADAIQARYQDVWDAWVQAPADRKDAAWARVNQILDDIETARGPAPVLSGQPEADR